MNCLLIDQLHEKAISLAHPLAHSLCGFIRCEKEFKMGRIDFVVGKKYSLKWLNHELANLTFKRLEPAALDTKSPVIELFAAKIEQSSMK